MQVRVATNRLIEDAEVVAGGLKMPLLLDLENRVQRSGSRRDDCDAATRADVGDRISAGRISAGR